METVNVLTDDKSEHLAPQQLYNGHMARGRDRLRHLHSCEQHCEHCQEETELPSGADLP